MNILITNDDGYTSDGLVRLARAAQKYGKVWVVAPDGERSCNSRKITLRKPIDVYEVDFPVEGVKAFKTTGTPADCVRLAANDLIMDIEGEWDLVLSGINHGYNSGSDLQYSATAGAALEGRYWGMTAIAFSEHASDDHEVTDAYLEVVLDELLEQPLERNAIWNVNFPGCKLEECKGILRDRKVSHNGFYRDRFVEEALPDGGRRFHVEGIFGTDAPEGTDFKAIVDNYVSIGKVRNLG